MILLSLFDKNFNSFINIFSYLTALLTKNKFEIKTKSSSFFGGKFLKLQSVIFRKENIILYMYLKMYLHQWPSGSALKVGRREVPGSNLGRACRLSRLEFSGIFSKTLVSTG